NGAARRIDVELQILLRVLAGEKEHLRDHQVRDLIVDRRSQENDVVTQQTAVNVVGAFAPARLLDNHRYKCHALLYAPRRPVLSPADWFSCVPSIQLQLIQLQLKSLVQKL